MDLHIRTSNVDKKEPFALYKKKLRGWGTGKAERISKQKNLSIEFVQQQKQQ